MARTALNVDHRDDIRTGKGAGKTARKRLQAQRKKRNVPAHYDRWAQIQYLYMKHNDPMPTSYYDKQVEWYTLHTGGELRESYLRDLKKYYDEHKHRLIDGRVPVRLNRRKLEREKKREQERTEAPSEGEEEQRAPQRRPIGKGAYAEAYLRAIQKQPAREKNTTNDMRKLLEEAYSGNVRLRQALLKALDDADTVKAQLGEAMAFH
jgi:hypothetical protein